MLKRVRGMVRDNVRFEGRNLIKRVNAKAMSLLSKVEFNGDVLVDAHADQRMDVAGQDFLDKSLLRAAMVAA